MLRALEVVDDDDDDAAIHAGSIVQPKRVCACVLAPPPGASPAGNPRTLGSAPGSHVDVWRLFFPLALLLTTTRPASAMLVVSRRALFMLRCPLCCHRCAAKASKATEYFSVTHPPRIEAGYSIERREVGIVDLKPRDTSCLEPKTLLQQEVLPQEFSKVEDEMPKLQLISKIK